MGPDRIGELAAQHSLALLGDEPRLGVADLADALEEQLLIELAVHAFERRILGDPFRHFGVGNRESELPHTLIKRREGHHLSKQLLLNSEGAGLIRRDRAADSSAELLKFVGITLAKLIDGDISAANLGDRVHPKASEYVANAPDAERNDQGADHDRHDRFAEPTGGGFT